MTTYETERLAVCADCLYTDANGWDESETGEPMPTPRPLCLLPDGASLGPALCRDNCEGWQFGTCAECEAIAEGHFSWNACRGCGGTLGGTRYDVTMVAPVYVCECGAKRSKRNGFFPAHPDMREYPKFAWCAHSDTSTVITAIEN